MNIPDLISLTAGLLQFGVACYLLRVVWFLRAPRVGWLLFSVLGALGLLCFLLLPISPLRHHGNWAWQADLIYSLISILLLAGVFYIELRFKQRLEEDAAGRRAQSEWEAQVEKEWAVLTKSHDDLRVAAKEQWVTLTRANEDLQQAIDNLLKENADQKQNLKLMEATHKAMLITAHHAGQSEVAARLQDSVNLLEVITRRQIEFTRTHFANHARPSRKPSRSSSTAAPRTTRSKKQSVDVSQLAKVLWDEQSRLLETIESVRSQLVQFKAQETTGEGDTVVIDATMKAAAPAGAYPGPTETATTQENGSPTAEEIESAVPSTEEVRSA